MDSGGVTRKLAAILSADVKGYARLMGEDEAWTVQTIKSYRGILAAQVRKHRGRVVDAAGDNLLAEFSSVVDAVRCGVEIQREIARRNADLPEHRRMEFRIGINLGDVIQDGERIYGEGVNIAARLEMLAEAGGICISGGAYEQVRNKLDVGYEYLGEQHVKNITEPVRAFRIVTDPKVARSVVFRHKRDDPRHRLRATLIIGAVVLAVAAGMAVWRFLPSDTRSPGRAAREDRMAFTLPDKPSIVVLPFQNLSPDKDQEYFSDGLTEDLITDLSKLSGLFVIARNSAFTYKGRTITISQVAQDLGVRYVLEGSVRRRAGKVRINAQLIDAATGYHLWAERYDRDMEDIFALQDEVVGRIVSALKVHLTERERRRLVRQETQSTIAYDLVLRARQKKIFTREGNLARRRLFQKAIEIDPGYADAYSGLGWTFFNDWAMGWSTDPQVLDRAFNLAQRSFQLDGDSALAPILMGEVYLWKKEHDHAIEKLIETIKLYPNEAMAHAALADILIWSGRPRRALSVLDSAIRLDPRNQAVYWSKQAQAHLLMEDYGQSIALAEKTIARYADYLPAHLTRAIACAESGLLDKARESIGQVKRINPGYSLSVTRMTAPYRDPALLDRHTMALRKAGLD